MLSIPAPLFTDRNPGAATDIRMPAAGLASQGAGPSVPGGTRRPAEDRLRRAAREVTCRSVKSQSGSTPRRW